MNGTAQSARGLARDVRNTLGSHHGTDMVVFPPTAFLSLAHAALQGGRIQVGAQDIHPRAKGAFTSGTSAAMVKSLGCTWTLVGHSERRAWFGDSDARVAEKLAIALAEGLCPILCVGETLEQRNAGQTTAVVHRQISSAVEAHRSQALTRLVIAYEPVWAIGTGVTASVVQASEVHQQIRGIVAGHFGSDFAEQLRIQYGGSVKPDNAASLMADEHIDGALVGGASLDARSFSRIVHAAGRRGYPAAATWEAHR